VKHYALCQGSRVIDASSSRRSLQRRANENNERGSNPAFRVLPLNPSIASVAYSTRTMTHKRSRAR
jgi:hypothetical protein